MEIAAWEVSVGDDAGEVECVVAVEEDCLLGGGIGEVAEGAGVGEGGQGGRG